MIFYGPEEAHRALELGQKSHEATTCLGGAPPRARPLACGRFVAPLDLFPTQKIPINTKNPKNKTRSGVPPPQASVATKTQSGARSGTLPEGETITGGHLHHPGGLHDEEGVVHPRG